MSTRIEVRPDAAEIYSDLQRSYHESLLAPADDMWAAFADLALPYGLLVDGDPVGFCSVNEAKELMSFYVESRFENHGENLFDELTNRLQIVAAFPSTVDPSFLSLSLGAGRRAVPKALLFAHMFDPAGEPLTKLRLASVNDHSSAVAFAEEAVGAPRSFLEPYFGERIEKGELLLHEEGSEIVASGECRLDQRQTGFAHLGMIVGRGHRGQGLGTSMMHALVLESRRRKLEPLCSTEPGNLAARHAIHKAGFRGRHRVFRVAFDPET